MKFRQLKVKEENGFKKQVAFFCIFYWEKTSSSKRIARKGLHFLSTRDDRQSVDISVTVCFVCPFVCVVTDFFAEYKASGVILCSAVHQRPSKKSPIFVNFAPQNPKLDESASVRAMPTRI